ANGTSSFRGGYSISYLQDGLSVVSNVLACGTFNPGLTLTVGNTVPTGVLTSAGVPLATPTFKMPVTDLDNYTANTGNGLIAIKPDLRIPYVQQWSFGFERAINRNTAFEVRYVGNHAIKMWRSNDYNEINIFENGFFNEFLSAQKNLAINGGASFAPGAAGTSPLPIMSTLFTGLPSASGFTSSGFISNLNNNNVAGMAATLAMSPTYRPTRALLPANFFLANPNAAFIRLLDNSAMSNYNAVQVEIRRRFARGLQFNADYTFGKALTDGPNVYALNSTDNFSFRTLRNRRLDYERSISDQTHRFVFNSVYHLPFGANRAILGNAHGILNQIFGDWTLSAIVLWKTPSPFFISGNRSTFNNANIALSNPAQ